MILKRIASKGNKKARNCLKCNSRLLNLKDNVVNTCEVCGQQHLVDFYTNNTIVLTAAERPELRKRPGTPKPEQPEREQNQEAFNKRLAAVKKEATITGKGDAWGTITIKDDTGETREYYWKEKEKE